MRHFSSFKKTDLFFALNLALLPVGLAMVGACREAPTASEERPLDDAGVQAAIRRQVTPTPVDDQRELFAAGDFSSCLVCHGARAAGNPAVGGPPLAGLPSWYVRSQLNAFRQGWRGTHPDDNQGQMMHAIARLMDDEAIAGAVEFVANLDAPAEHHSLGQAAGSVSSGGSLYAQRCASCHGPSAEGNEAMHAPPLADMDGWYLSAQLAKYSSKVRGYHAEDVYGAQMIGLAQSLSAGSVDDLAAYLASVRP